MEKLKQSLKFIQSRISGEIANLDDGKYTEVSEDVADEACDELNHAYEIIEEVLFHLDYTESMEESE